MSNTITAFFKGRIGVAESVYQYDYGTILIFDGLALPSVFEVHFATLAEDDSITVIGSNNRVAIPNTCLNKTGVVTAYVYLHTGDNDGETEYIVRFGVVRRVRPDYDEDEKSAWESAAAQALAMLQNPRKVNTPLDNYNQVNNGNAGQILRTKGNGATEWVDVGTPTDEQTASAVSAWLDDHPEATTTVLDKSLTLAKFKPGEIPFVTPEMFGAIGDGGVDDTEALISMFDTSMPVFIPDKTYLVSDTLIYEGDYIIGSGTIKSSTPLEKVMQCLTDNIVVEGISIDCNNMSAMGIYCYGSEQAAVTNCHISNTQNADIETAVQCAGIFLSGYSVVSVKHNYISNINRTKTNPYNISSAGIVARTDGTADISNNYIDTVKCSAETTDCDGIYVTFASGTHDTAKNTADIRGNVIRDSTGRFIKTQCHNAIISNNDCRLIDSASDLFFKAVDFQSGGGECANNYFDLGNKAALSATFIHVDYISFYDRCILVRNNLCRTTIEVASFMNCERSAGGQIIIDGNTREGNIVDYLINITPSNDVKLKLLIQNNHIPFYRMINPVGGNDFQNISLFVIGNTSTYTSNAIFASEVSINNIVVRNNIGIAEVLSNITMDFSKMKCFELIYQNANPIANALSWFGDTTHIYMKSLGYNLLQFYRYSDDVSKIGYY